MRIRHRALLLALVFCASLLLSMGFVAALSDHHCHHCEEEPCPVCLALESCRALLAFAGLAAAWRAFCAPAAARREAEPEPLPLRAATPVSRKVKLLD